MRFVHRLSYIFLGIIVCAALAGCGGISASSGGGTPPAVALSASPGTVTLGQSVTLTWSSAGADSCTASASMSESDWSGSKTTSGSQSATPPATGTQTYTLACTNAAGTSSASAKITVNGPAAPKVMLAAAPTTITLGQSTTLTWSSTNANSCTASAAPAEGDWSGAKATSGSQAASPGATGTETYTLSCTGAGGTASASAAVTVNANSGGLAITGIVPASVYLDAAGTASGVEIDGSGFAPGCTLHDSLFGDTTLPNGVNPNQIVVDLPFDTEHYSPGWVTFSVLCASAASNAANLAFVGNQNTLALSATQLFQLDQAQGLPNGQNGFARIFNLDGTANGSFQVGAKDALPNGIAFDDSTGLVLVTYPSNQVALYDSTSTPPGMLFTTAGVMPGSATVAVATTLDNFNNPIACTTQPAVGMLSCFVVPSDPVPPAFTSAPAGTAPWSLAMTTLGGKADAIVYDREGTQLLGFSVIAPKGQQPVITPAGTLTLSGITPASQLTGMNGGWQLVAFGSGIASGTAAFLSQFDQVLVFVDLSTMTELRRVALQAIPLRIAGDETHGAVIVAFADVNSGLTQFATVDVATGTVRKLGATSPLLTVGLLVSADGTTIHGAMRDQASVLNNQ